MTPPAGGVTVTVGLIASDRQLIDRARLVALELGIDLHVLSPPGGKATSTATASHGTDFPDDLAHLIASAARCDVVTFESSAISASHRGILFSAGITLRPGPQATELADDSTTARQALRECGFDVVAVPDIVGDNPLGLQQNGNMARRRTPSGGTWVADLNVVVARRPSGLRVVYPVVETGRSGRLRLAPTTLAVTPASTAEHAVGTAISIADGIDATGIIAINFLLAADKRPFVNSILLGLQPQSDPISNLARTSQIENHLRGILDWPLGTTTIETPRRRLWRAPN